MFYVQTGKDNRKYYYYGKKVPCKPKLTLLHSFKEEQEHCSGLKLLVDFVEVVGIDIGDGDAANLIEGDHDTAVFLDTVDGAFDSGEHTIGDSYPAAYLLGKILVGQEHHPVVLHRSHPHEIVH